MTVVWNTLLLSLAFGICATAVRVDAASNDDTDQGFLLVANKGDQTLSIVDPRSGTEVAKVPVGGTTGHEVAASPDGQTAWVPVYGNSGVGKPGTDGRVISIVDLKTRARVGEIDLGVPTRPHQPVFGPDGKLYVTAELTDSIQVIDPTSRKILGSVPTGAAESHMMVISPDGKRAYTANVGPGTVSVIDVPGKKVLATIPVAKIVQRIAMSVDGRWVFTADQTKPQIAVIDTHTNKVDGWIAMPDLGYGIAVTPDGSRLVIAHPGSNSVSIVSLQSKKVLQTVHVARAPQEVLVRPDGHVAYVSCDQSKQVAVIDLSKGELEKSIAVGPGADGLAWAVQRHP
jgi:YVTN family beta-propeller protein